MPLTARDGLAIISAALAAIALGAAAWLLLAPGVTGSIPPLPTGAFGALAGSPAVQASADPTALLVDVQGGVRQPGLVQLAPGSRVADAIAAAGGYSDLADLLVAAASVNLAAPITDGQQVFVPLAGVATAGGGGNGAAGGGSGGGLLNLNTASADELDALPGIGPVTVQKIVDARTEQRFATLDELVDRKVLNRGQLDDIRDLVTV